MTTPAVIEAQYRVLQALETAIYNLGPRPAGPVDVFHSGSGPDAVDETVDLRQRQRRLVPRRAVRHVDDHVGPRLPS